MSNFVNPEDYDSSIHDEILHAVIRDDEAIVEIAEDQAISEMKGYLQSKFDVNAIFSAIGDARNSLILMFVKDIALYHIHSIHNPVQFSQIRKDRYDRAIEWLKAVQKGQIIPDLPLLTDDSLGIGGERTILSSSNPKRITHY